MYNGNNTTIPENVDWRDHNIVTDVKDQYWPVCGSCKILNKFL